jgi:[protein-PII] uridylyltransferase
MRTILKDPTLREEAKALLSPPLVVPNGDVRQEFSFNSNQLSFWLGLRLEEVIKSFPDWKKTGPVLLGSWARGELSLKSDIDMLFCGEEEKTLELVSFLNEQGYKLRYRMPQDREDWTVNVEAFDVLALLKAKPLTPEAAALLIEQQKKILQKRKVYGKTLLKALRQERKERARRFDSITNFLEPNIKYGPGGLRDLEQGLQIYELFSEKIPQAAHTLNVLKYYKSYLLTLRQKLHLEGLGDILVNTAQFDLAKWMGFKNQKDFMRDLQRGLSRVHFYSEWLLQTALASEAEIHRIEKISFKKPVDLWTALKKNPSVLMQKRVREKMDDLWAPAQQKKNARQRGQILDEMLAPKTSDAVLVAVFQSRLIDKLLPAIRHLVGYVQHDQYHRFTAETHIMQACREFKRIYHQPRELAALRFVPKKIKPQDWKVLQWACLYHDLAKGLESQDHSDLGVEIVRRDFKDYAFAKSFTEDVAWLVKNHLELSSAAFRKNPKSPRVWQELKEKNVEGAALYRLALFTVMDIRATNPEAWNDWKSRLLKDLVENLESKSAQNYFNFSEARRKKKLKLPLEIYEELDPLLVDSVPTKILVDDLKKAEISEESLRPLFVKNRSEIWIRLHHKKDRPGILASYVTQLYSLGVRIRHASIQTLPKVGVYDWFQIATSKNPEILKKWIENSSFQERPVPSVRFSQIELMSSDEKEWVFSFKGQDQPGLLAAASQALAENGISIKAAKVHTWGRQIEDVFIVKPKGLAEELLKKLRAQFIDGAG